MNVEFESSDVAVDASLVDSAVKALSEAYIVNGHPQPALKLQKERHSRYHALTDSFVIHRRFWPKRYPWTKIKYVTHSGQVAAFATTKGRVKICVLESKEKALEFCHVFTIQGVKTIAPRST